MAAVPTITDTTERSVVEYCSGSMILSISHALLQRKKGFLIMEHNMAISAYAPFGFDVVGECHMYDQDFLCYQKELD